MLEQVEELVFETLREFGANENITGLDNPTVETFLYGDGGVLDSLALVSLISDLEMKLEERFGVQLTLADERAMSRKQSPFRTAGALAEFVREALVSYS